MTNAVEVNIAGETLIARAGKTLFWPSEATLFAADIHLGKDAALRASAVPIPHGPTPETLFNLTREIAETNAARLVLLGDLWHAKAGRSDDALQQFAKWRALHEKVDITLVEGNHDEWSGPLSPEFCVREVAGPLVLGPFALCHYPQKCDLGYVLSGHLHPGVVLEGAGRQSIKVPCFWFGKEVAILPAFGSFTGCSKVSPVRGDQVLLLVDGRIHDATKLALTAQLAPPSDRLTADG